MTTIPFYLDAMRSEDYPAVAQIFEQGIDGGNATYDTASASWDEWDQKHVAVCRWVIRAKEYERVLGWAALSPVSPRYVFRGVAELSIYVANEAQGVGAGNALMDCIVKDAESQGFWTLQSGIFPENIKSIRLHEKFGFRTVGRRERIGQMRDGRWRDIILMERRSSTVG